MTRLLLAAVVAATMSLFALTASAGAAIGVSSFSLTPSTTASGANPNLAVSANRTGTDNDDLKRADLKLPAGLNYSVAGIAKCSTQLFNQDRCPANSNVGSAAINGKLSLFGVTLVTGSMNGNTYALANNQLGTVLSAGLLPKTFVKTNITGNSASGITLSTGDYPRVGYLLGLLPTDLTISSVSYSYKGAVGATNIVTNPTTCGAAQSTLTFVPFSGSSASANSSFNVTGCGPVDTEDPVVNITAPADGSTVTTNSVTVEYDVTDNEDASPTCNIADGSSVTLVEGPNTITVTCTDDAGNSGSDSVNVTYDAPDTEAPVVAIISPTNGQVLTSDSVIVDYTVSDNEDASPTCDIADGSSVTLVEGPNTITVNCSDDAGNSGSASVTVTYEPVPPPDTEDPVVNITAPADGSTVTTSSVVVEYDVTDNLDTSPTCDIADGATVSLVEGPNTITVNCSDDAGNIGSDSVSVTYDAPDTEDPVVNITAPVDGSTVAVDTVTVEYDVTDNEDASPTCDIADGSSVTLVEGPNTITVTCTDDAGNAGSDTVTVTYDAPDTEAPVVDITAPINGSTVTTSSVTVEYDVTDNEDASPTCDIADGSSVTLVEGSNTITVNCTDDAGNTGSDSVTITYDSTPPPDTEDPVVNITAPADGSTVTTSSVVVEYDVTDNLDTSPTCDIADGATVSLVEGPNTITVNCSDDAGNIGSDSVSVTYDAPDTEDPVVNITAPVDGSTVTTSSVVVEYDVTDNEDASPTCDIADGSSVTLVEGPNTITVTCTDDAGNAGSDSVTVTYDAPDTEDPVVTITNPLEGQVFTTDSATVEYDVTDNEDASPTCNIADGSSVTLVEGPNTITVTCTDDAGNAGSDTVNVTYNPTPPPDTEDPVVNITAPVDGSTVTTSSVVVEYDVTDNLDTSPTCDIADGATVSLVEGPNTITVNCSDDAGNIGSDSVSVTYDAPDTEDPVVNITAPVDGSTVAVDTVTVEYDVTDNEDASPSCNIADGSSVTLVEGPNTITVTCTDDAGNSGSDSVTVTYDAPDTEDPVVTITNPLEGQVFTTDSATVEYDVTDNEDASPTCNIADGSSVTLVEGPNTITVTCTDDAGNSGSDSVTVTYDAPDTEDPVVTITSPADGATTEDATIVVEYDVTDNEDASPTCDIADGASVPLSVGPNTITVTCTDDAGNAGSDTVNVTRNESVVPPNTTLGDALPALPTLTPNIPVSSDTGTGFECQVNDAPAAWAACNPNTGTYGAGLTFNDAATNKVEIRAVLSGTPDPSPVTTYIWTDNDPAPSATATVTPSTTQAGGHPSLTSTVTLNGGWNPKSVTINVPAGFNAGLTAVSQKCTFSSNPNAMDCATTAPGSFIGTLSGTGVSTSAGFLSDATGNLYMTTSPNSNSPAGVWLDMASPSHPELGRIRATAEARIVQEDDNTAQGNVYQRLIIPSIPQRTDNGSRFHVNTATLNLLGDPPGGTYPLLTNPTSCPATPVQFTGVGTTYGTDGLDSSTGPAVPQVNVPYPVTGCGSLPFEPQITQEFFAWDPIDGSAADPSAPVIQSIGTNLFSNDSTSFTRLAEFGVTADVTIAEGSKMIKDIVSYQPASLGANLPAFGTSAQKCTGSGVVANDLWPGACPVSGIAEIGYMTINTPLLEEPLVGRVKGITKTPIPWIGIEIAHNATWGANNPVGVTLRLLGTTNLEDPPDCVPSPGIPSCTDSGHIVIRFSELPDVPLTGAFLDMSGSEARPLGTLSPLLLIGPDEGDPGCVPNDAAVTTFTPQGSVAGGPDDVTRIQNTSISNC